MNILTAEDIVKVYGDKRVLDCVSLGIDDSEKIGIIGINGTGKSTLLKIIAGLETPEEGQVVTGRNLKIRYLPQNPEFSGDETILSYVMADADVTDESDLRHWTLESDAKALLSKLGFEDFGMKTGILSGGQKKRVALVRTLLSKADLLIMDEPTNHLDNSMTQWLEDYLKQYRGALLMVTHDRYFLDSVTNVIVEIDRGGLYRYEANYSQFIELKAERMDMALATERKRKSVLRNELAWMMRGARARSTKQKARIERYETMKSVSDIQADDRVAVNTLSQRMGSKTIEVKDISKGYDGRQLFKDFTYIFLKNDRIGIVGENGAGKSTLLKIIQGIEQPDSGTVTTGQTISVGCFAQENEMPDANLRVIDYIREVAEYIQTDEGTTSASQMLERFLFSSEMQYTPVGKLSGGEKRRLYLLRVLMKAPNVLILDEPTNDLDIQTLTILEDYLDHFNGIVITVSHDRYFLDRVVRRIFAFEPERVIRQYEGGFTDYWLASEDRRLQTEAKRSDAGNAGDAGDAGQNVKPAKKTFANERPQKLKFTFKEQREFDTIDEDIAALETAIENAETGIAKNTSDYMKLNELMKEKESLAVQLEEKMERWVYLNDLAEKIEQQSK